MDWCTWWPEGWWAHCCQAHDAGYAAQIGQALADERLLQCVAESAPEPWLAGASLVVGGLMFLGVRMFGRRYYGKSNADGGANV